MTDVAELEKRAAVGDTNAMREVAQAYTREAKEWNAKRMEILRNLAKGGDVGAMEELEYLCHRVAAEWEEKAKEQAE